MSIEVACPHCGSLNHVHERLRGRRVRCPHCDGDVDIPEVPLDLSAKKVPKQGSVSVATERVFATSGTLAGEGFHLNKIGYESSVGASVRTQTSESIAAVVSDDDEDDALPVKLKPEEGELDMTPMVDVTFLLLIFFMITAAFSLQKSIESPRQESDKPSMNSEPIETEELDLVTVQINEFGSYLVMAPDWERETPGKQNLILALREAMGDGKTAMKLSIEVHEAAKLQALVDCMDAGTICDYGELKVTQVESFDE